MPLITTRLLALVTLALATVACGPLHTDVPVESPEYIIGGASQALEGLDLTGSSSEISELEYTGGWTGFVFQAPIEQLPSSVVAIEV